MLVALVGKVDLVLKVGVVVTAVLVSKEVGTRVWALGNMGNWEAQERVALQEVEEVHQGVRMGNKDYNCWVEFDCCVLKRKYVRINRQ